jgi:hypothetical protein
MRTCVPRARQLAASHRRHAACSTITADQPIDVPPDVALLLPEPDDGGLPELKPLELPELEVPELPELLELPEVPEVLEPPEVPALDFPAGLPWWLLGTPETPDSEPVPAVCWAEPGRTNATAPAAAIPLTPMMAVSDRTADRPRSLAATALATLLRFIATPRNSWRIPPGQRTNRMIPPTPD